MRLVIIESPYSGDIEANIAYAQAAMWDCLQRGEAPYASHLLYTQVGVLDDSDPAQRKRGIEAGLLWGRFAEATVVYADRGISAGMQQGIDRATAEGRPVEYRSIDVPATRDPATPSPVPQKADTSSLIKALSRLSGNRHSDGVSSLVSQEDRSAIINGCHDLMVSSRQAPAPQVTGWEADEIAKIEARFAAINAVLGDGAREDWMRPLEEEFAFLRGRLSILRQGNSSAPCLEVHPDDSSVDQFASAMKAKLAQKRSEGRSGWEDKDDCSQLFLSALLREHVEKGDPLDVGNFAMMIHQRGERIASLLEVIQGE